MTRGEDFLKGLYLIVDDSRDLVMGGVIECVARSVGRLTLKCPKEVHACKGRRQYCSPYPLSCPIRQAPISFKIFRLSKGTPKGRPPLTLYLVANRKNVNGGKKHRNTDAMLKRDYCLCKHGAETKERGWFRDETIQALRRQRGLEY